MKKNLELFLIALIPPQDFSNTVRTLKWEAKEKFDTSQALKAPPHLTLHMPFKLRADRINNLIIQLENIASNFPKISIELNGIGCFEPSVLFVDVKSNDTLTDLHRTILSIMRKEFNLFNGLYKDKPFHPHFTFAFRDLKKSKFQDAWNYFKNREIAENFVVDQITLLQHKNGLWKEMLQFTLMGQS